NTRGSFQKSMQKQADQLAVLERRWMAFSTGVTRAGSMIEGNALSAASGAAKMTAALSGAAAVYGMKTLVSEGLKFNAELEETQLSIGAMFQLYRQNASNVEMNLKAAGKAQRELFDMAKESPVTFQQATKIYQGAASGLIIANQSLQQQMAFMRRGNMMSAILPDLSADIIGGQIGRILTGGAGAEFETWKRLAPEILKVGQAQKLFNKNMLAGQKFTQKFNELAQAQPATAADLIYKAMEPLEEMAETFRRSWGGILSATKSNMQIVAAAFTKPFYIMRKNLLYELNNSGLFAPRNLAKLEHIATVFGMFFAQVSERAFSKLMGWVDYLVDNWERITEGLYETGQAVGKAIKAAFFIGVARLAAGKALQFAGGGMQMAGRGFRGGRAAYEMMGNARKDFFRTMARGALRPHGKGGGLTGWMGRMTGRAANSVSSGVSNLAARSGNGMRSMALASTLVGGCRVADIFQKIGNGLTIMSKGG